MTNNINAPVDSGFAVKSAGHLSMISMLAISVGLAAAPAHAQSVATPDMTAPAPAPTVATPQPAPAPSATMAPTVALPPAGGSPAAKVDATPPVNADRADDLAQKGGFDAKTVAPEALAQIQSEQQARKAAAADATAAIAKPAVKASASPTNRPANSAATSTAAAPPEPATDPVAGFSPDLAIGAGAPVAAIPNVGTAPPEVAASPDTTAGAGESNADWGLLAALAALLGVGGAGAYAVGRRRKSKGQAAVEINEVEVHGRDPFPAEMNEAIMPELRRDPIMPKVDSEQVTAQTVESNVSTKVAFANFVANLPELDVPLGRDGSPIGERRVAAAPRPYLGEADLSRPEGYFTTNVDAMPTPQNPFLTREKRQRRARLLDRKLTEMKASVGEARRKMDREMEAPRPLEPAFS
ncbi:hypothetical protein [uncultured Parasphingorhabdus sp.]|uniref:hypothetical protein n=1 Tax=uncultured Parasphingorhabdus sp. TaxID=2709694 RepID=UPI0030DD8330|tara:strand:- start:26318 stop:27550 length:1233 start_codon:yes stop_codon:yes gene_type:complete